jgi:hypothetical protein
VSPRTSKIKKAFKVAGGKTGCITHITAAISWEENKKLFFPVPAVTVSKIELVRTQPSRLNDCH